MLLSCQWKRLKKTTSSFDEKYFFTGAIAVNNAWHGTQASYQKSKYTTFPLNEASVTFSPFSFSKVESRALKT